MKRCGEAFPLFFLIIGLCFGNGFPKVRTMTVDDVLKLKTVLETRLSPDGQWVLFTVREADPKDNRFNIDLYAVPSAGGEAIRLTYTPAVEYHPRWSPDGKSVAFISNRNGSNQIFLIPFSGGEARKITPREFFVESFEWSPDGSRIAFVSKKPRKDEQQASTQRDIGVLDESFAYSYLWLLDLATKNIEQLTSGPFQVDGFDWAPDGKQLVFSHRPTPKLVDRLRSDISILQIEKKIQIPLVFRPGMDILPRFSPDGKTVAFLSQDQNKDWFSNLWLCLIDLRSQKIKNISTKYDNRIETYFWSPDGRTLWFIGLEKTNRFVWKIRRSGGTPTPVATVPGVYRGASVSGDGEFLSFVYESGDLPSEVFISPTKRITPQRLTFLHSDIDSFQICKPQIITWRSKDGLPIDGLLYLPRNAREGKPAPLLVILHGGPAESFTNSFLSSALYPIQVFASKGFAVLLPNPRGSDGYGYAFRAANRKDWGGKDFNDIISGVDHLIATGVADSSRLGVMGWSYGGYMAAWIICQTHRFKAASVGAGVSNLYSFVGQTDIPDYMVSYWGAWPWNEPELFLNRSPVFHAQKIQTPTLILHGEQDERVPIDQSRELYTALKEHGVETEFVVYPHQQHGISNPKHLRNIMQRNVEWMVKWLRNGKK